MVIRGMALHVHHSEQAVEWVWDYEERLYYIQNHKPQDEQELRLRLFKMIPIERIPEELRGMWEESERLREESDKLWSESSRLPVGRLEDINRLRLQEESDNLWRESDRLREDLASALSKRHSELCVADCPWDGRTIFPGRVEE